MYSGRWRGNHIKIDALDTFDDVAPRHEYEDPAHETHECKGTNDPWVQRDNITLVLACAWCTRERRRACHRTRQ